VSREIVIGALRLKRIEFPGAASELQSIGATAALMRELGDNYPVYNQYLAKRMLDLGGRPDPVDYPNDFAGYTDACDETWETLVAEALIRRCRANRLFGDSLAQTASPDTPLVDDRHRLVSVETGAAVLPDSAGSPAAAAWKPPPMPWADGKLSSAVGS
jgi:hypothetical protein